ncbi:MAG: MoaD/ThiS family protein [Chloroflexota bacterium]
MKLHAGGHLTFYIPERKHMLEISLGKPTPLREILAQLGIPLPEVALTALNGELVEAESVIVNDNDQVRIFPAVNGG